MRLRPALILAAPAGVLGGHAIGYLVAPEPAGQAAVHHGYLALALAVAVPLAVLAVGWATTSGVAGRRRFTRMRPVPVGPLVLAQWMLFTGQEVVEHAAAGHGAGAAFHSPALWCGLAAQVLTAAAVAVLLGASAASGSRLVVLLGRSGTPVLLPAVLWRPALRLLPRSLCVAAASPSRGPPAVRFT